MAVRKSAAEIADDVQAKIDKMVQERGGMDATIASKIPGVIDSCMEAGKNSEPATKAEVIAILRENMKLRRAS